MKKTDPIQIPSFMYGTAWKKEATPGLVHTAVKAGFVALDTANQAKHYSEPLVGEALIELARNGVTREKLFLQTKFTSVDGQDHRLPYDESATISEQVAQSFESSLQHLHTDYLDSYLLHGPYNFPGLGEEDWEVWGAIEKIYRSGKAKYIGVSNVNAAQLQMFIEKAEIKPMMVQNRCYANRGWDRAVRELCNKNGIVYQGFSLLTANIPLLHSPRIIQIAQRLQVLPTQVIFAFARQIGMLPLTGTSNEQHMKEDLHSLQLQLTAEEVALIERMAEH